MSQPFMGQILAVGFNFAPRGWSIANGAMISIAQNSALFALLGTSYGGNGQTTFALPNLQGRVAVGQGQSGGTSMYSLGEVAGTENVTLTINNLPTHNHQATASVPTLSGVTASTTINVLTQPTARQAGPAGALLTGATDAGGAPVTGYALPGAGTANTLATEAATTALGGAIGAPTITVGVAGNSIPVNTQPPYVVINYVIALEGIFPSRN